MAYDEKQKLLLRRRDALRRVQGSKRFKDLTAEIERLEALVDRLEFKLSDAESDAHACVVKINELTAAEVPGGRVIDVDDELAQLEEECAKIETLFGGDA